jgi:23S rRNA pseudoU1915 N3-methylase RlmH
LLHIIQENIKAHTKKIAITLAAQYNDLKNIDKIHQVQGSVKSIENELGEDIKKIIINGQNLNALDERADKMKSN